MDKIKYILSLNNIKMSDDAKKEIRDKLIVSKFEYAKKKRKKVITVITVVVLSALLIAGAAFLAVHLARTFSGTDEPVTDVVVITAPPMTTVTDTPYPRTDPPVTANTLIVAPLYNFYDNYDIFRAAVSCMIPTEEGDTVVLSGDKSRLARYFGEQAEDEELCETLFAFYDRGNAFRYDSIPEERAYAQKIADKFAMASDGYMERTEIIALAAKCGSFEYLLTFSLLEPADGYNGVDHSVFNTDGNIVGGYVSGTGYCFDKEMFHTVSANVYKVRMEYGVPVIYQRTEIAFSNVEYDSGDLVARASDANVTFTDGVLSTGTFYTQSRNFMLLSTKENDMISIAGAVDISSAYPYSYPKGDETDVFSRKMICDIINEFDLQWFFPYYLIQSQVTTKVIGAGITTPTDSERIYSSVSYIADGSGIYFDLLANRITEPFYYDPQICDRPYFSYYFINNKGGLPMCEIDLVQRTVTMCDTGKYPPAAYKNDGLSEGEFEFYYLSMADKKNTEAHPFTGYGADLLPFCDSVAWTPESAITDRLHLKLYKSVYQLEINFNDDDTVSFADYYIMTKKMTALGITDVTNGYTVNDGKKYYIVFAYHNIGDFIADINGLIVGVRVNGDAYLFDTVSPLFEFLIIADEDGYLLYMGPESELWEDNSGMSGIDYRFKKTQSGAYYGTFVHAVSINRPYDMILSMKEEGYEINAETALLTNKAIYHPVRSGSRMKYSYLNGKIVTYKDLNGKRTLVTKQPTAVETGLFVFFSDQKDKVKIINNMPVFEAQKQ